MRCKIPEDAVDPKVRLLFVADASDPGIITAVYATHKVSTRGSKKATLGKIQGGFRGCLPPPNNDYHWTCELLFGKGLLAPQEWTLPQKELHGLSSLANLKVVLYNVLSDWILESAFFSDSEIALSWTCYERVKLSTFVRNRSFNI